LRSKGTYFEKGYEYERNKKKVDVDVALSLFFGKIPRNDIEKGFLKKKFFSLCTFFLFFYVLSKNSNE